MQGKRTVNTLHKGMSMDVDIQNQENSSYRYSMNGNLIYNKDGTFSWKTLNGNLISIPINPNQGNSTNQYTIIGSTGGEDVVVLFMVDRVTGNSEIGIFTLDSNGRGSYKTMFNDINDPNGDLLQFKTKNQIEARYLFENPNCIRVYFVDGVEIDSNQPRTFTFSHDGISDTSDVNSYTPLTSSVHSMNSQSDFSMGIIKFQEHIGGNLLSGIYQYTYRLQTVDGYLTPWYPATRRVIVSASAKNSFDSNQYEYSQTGISTAKGNNIEIKGIDNKFVKIDVAYIYSQSDSVADSANIFFQGDISGSSMIIPHSANIGEPLSIDEIPAIFLGLRKAKTLNIKDSTLYYGNTVEGVLFNFNPEDVLANSTLKPIFRHMRSDMKPDNVNSSPLVSNNLSTFNTNIKLHNDIGGNEVYLNSNDYSNYKSTQVDHLYTGYWRGETYRIGIVFFDKQGFQSFVYHIGDIRMPEQYEDEFSYSRVKEDGSVINFTESLPNRSYVTNSHGRYAINESPIIDGEDISNGTFSHLRIMGLEVNGIDLTSVKNQISGFQIVRARLDKTIEFQGLIMPTVQRGNIVFPLPTSAQSFVLPNQSTPFIPDPGGTNGYDDTDIQYSGVLSRNENNNPNGTYRPRSQLSTIYAPEIDFGLPTPTISGQDQIKLIGSCFGATNEGPLKNYFIQTDHSLTKYYYTDNEFHNFSSYPYPRYGDSMSPLNIINVGFEGNVQPSLFTELTYKNEVNMVASGQFGFSTGFGLESWGKEKTLLIEHDNIFVKSDPNSNLGNRFYRWPISTNLSLDRYGNAPLYQTSFISNYVRPNQSPYGGLSSTSISQTVFISTGHFQPVNNNSFQSPSQDIYNGIEVFGGDCYLDYHTQLRLYPDSEDDQTNSGNSYDDYAVGISFPLEARINHKLRFSPDSPKAHYPSVGSRTAASLHDGDNTNFQTGLYYYNEPEVNSATESFNLNSILLFDELTFFYAATPVEFKDNTNYPHRWRYTLEKIYGDPVDTWRQFQVNDFNDINGQYGEITSSIYLMNQIYSFQESAYGRLRASDRALIESDQGGTLSTGIGDKLDGVDYISTEFGNQHQWSLYKSDSSAYWIDVSKSKILRFGQDGKMFISDSKGIHQFLKEETPFFNNSDNPVNNLGITGEYDYDNDMAWFVFKRDRSFKSSSEFRDIVINSRVKIGNNVDSFTINEGDTSLIDWQYGLSANNGVVIPFNSIPIGENNHKYFYIKNIGFDVNVFTNNGSLNVNLFTALSNKSYLLFRENINSDWNFLEVGNDEIPDQRSTILYNEVNDSFIGFDSINPDFILSHKNKLMSVDEFSDSFTNNSLYINDFGRKGQTYDSIKRSYIDIPINEEALLPKVFDSIRVNCDKYFKNKLIEVILTTDNQYTRITPNSDHRVKYLEDVVRFPLRGLDQNDRLRGKHLVVRLVLDNISNEDDLLTNILTYFRNSNRY